jgi:hypothetical protein
MRITDETERLLEEERIAERNSIVWWNQEVIPITINDHIYHAQRSASEETFLDPCHGIIHRNWIENAKKEGHWNASWLYHWSNFDIRGQFRDDLDNEYYIFDLNGIRYQETFDGMEKRMRRYYVSSAGTALKNDVLNPYLNQSPILDVGRVMGFTDSGWKNPPDIPFTFPHGSIMYKGKSNISKILSKSFEVSELDDYLPKLQNLYDLTTIPFKDIIYCFGASAPFCHCLQTHTRLRPMLAITGPQGGKGKTIISELITSKWYGTFGIINGGDITEPSLRQYDQTTTCPILIDEVADLNDRCASYLKSTTGAPNGDNNKLGSGEGGQEISNSGEGTSAIVVTTNKTWNLMSLPAFRQRVINTEITEYPKKEGWEFAYEKLQQGEFLRCLIHFTTDWDNHSLYELYDHQDKLGFNGDDWRKAVITRDIEIGYHILTEFFKLSIDLKQLQRDIILCLNKTNLTGTDSLREFLHDQIEYGRYKPFGYPNGVKFNPSPYTWIQTPVYIAKYKDEDGYGFSFQNMQELAKHLGRTQNWNSNLEFITELQSAGIHIQYDENKRPLIYKGETLSDGSLCLTKGRQTRNVFLPLTELKAVFGQDFPSTADVQYIKDRGGPRQKVLTPEEAAAAQK